VYVDAYYSREEDKIHVSKRVNGKRILLTAAPEHVFYYEDGNGRYKTIFGDHCKKYSTNDIKKFRFELMKMRDKGLRIFESDINPIFRHLSDNYSGADNPKMNVCFFDIEAAFNIEKGGYAPPHDPFNEITAISMYFTAERALITLALLPPTYSKKEGEAIVSQFENTILFDDEAEMLSSFLELIEDVDILSGWNCIPKTENVWLTDRIRPLGDIKTGDEVFAYGKVLNTHISGSKEINKITLENGAVVLASDEHTIPIFYKKPTEHKRLSSLVKSRVDKNVADIRNMTENYDVYMEIKLRENDNQDLTYRQFINENLDALFSYDGFDVCVTQTITRDIVLSNMNDAQRKEMFPYTRLVSSFKDYPRKWESKKLPIERAQISSMLLTEECGTFVFRGNRPFTVRLDDVIPCDVLQLMGELATDGSFNKKNPSFTLYGNDAIAMEFYRDVAMGCTQPNILAKKKLKIIDRRDEIHRNAKASCIHHSFDMKRGSVLGLLSPLIYTPIFKKSVNAQVCSGLSYKQFSAFYSGLIDGDGCVSNNVIQLCNHDGSLRAVQELLAWNGIYSTVSKNVVIVSPSMENKAFIEGLTVKNISRATRMKEIKYFSRKKNSSNKKLKKLFHKDHVIVRVRSIEKSSDFVEMGDIHTQGQYFTCGGIVVHNSEQYDIPYTINRVKKILNTEATKKFCLWDVLPKEREYKSKFGSQIKTYDLVGKVHLDYLQLYQKHNTKQQLSYKLDYIGEDEVGANKIPYEGNLDDLYKKDFHKFIDYSRQDVNILYLIDNKLKFIELANQVAHQNCVTLKTTMGSVVLVEQAIINYMHKKNLIVPDKKLKPKFDDLDALFEVEEEKKPVVGAYVADPKIGLHHHIGCVDINSLYPSAIRALNMSPETIIGQIRPTLTMGLVEKRISEGTKAAEAWEGIFMLLELDHMHAEDDTEITVDFEDGKTKVYTGAQLYDYIFNPANHVCITANGTIFRTDVQGIIPSLLAEWYAERKHMQYKSKEHAFHARGMDVGETLANDIRKFF
jgi:hypothetical protein